MWSIRLSSKIIIGLLLSLAIITCFKDKSVKEDNYKVADFFKNETKVAIDKKIGEDKKEVSETYMGVLEIPSINLKRGFYHFDSRQNNVKYNIQVLTKSNPKTGNLMLAAHSGNAYNAFFKDLNKLSLQDDIYVYYDNIKYIYRVSNINYQDKIGYITVLQEPNTLTLTTCSQEYKGKQLIIVGRLIDKENYY